MKPATVAVYNGTWQAGSKDSEAGSLWKNLPQGLQSDIQIQIVLFENGYSLIRAKSGDDTLFISTRDRLTQYLYRPAQNKVEFTPLDSNPLPPFFGFILPSSLTEQYVREGDPAPFVGQGRCEPTESRCREWIVDLSNGGMAALVTERPSGYSYSLTYEGRTGSRREWQFSAPDEKGFPKQIDYFEYRLEPHPVAHTRFILANRTTSSQDSNFRKLLPEDVQVHIKKGNVAYGGGLDKDSTTLWQTYDAQEAMHAEVAQEKQSIVPIVAAAVLLLGIVVFTVILLIGKQRGKRT